MNDKKEKKEKNSSKERSPFRESKIKSQYIEDFQELKKNKKKK